MLHVASDFIIYNEEELDELDTADGDIDLAIVLDNLSNSFTMQIQLMKLSRKFDTRIEPHPFDESDFNTSNPLANEILNKGIKIA